MSCMLLSGRGSVGDQDGRARVMQVKADDLVRQEFS